MPRFQTLTALCALLMTSLISGSALAQERASPPRPPGQDQPPPGSYQRACRGIAMSGYTLSAQCPGPKGAPVFSSINVNDCRGRDIFNDIGRLSCGRGAGGPQPPVPPRPVPPRPEPPRDDLQAVGYTKAGFRGKQLVIRGPIADLSRHRGFNDNIRSLRIIRGRAEVCVDRLFRGRCVTLRRSYPDLGAVGMANQISSIR